MRLPKIMVAPNGARLQKSDHPAVPISLDEIVACAKACQKAGAGALHLHLRDEDGGHLLDARAYQNALARLHQECPGLLIQITTEAAGKYQPAHQRQVALNSAARHVSVSVREIMGEPDAARSFYEACHAWDITIQHILYDVKDADLLRGVLPADRFNDPNLQLIYVLGRYSEGQASHLDMLDPFLAWMETNKLGPDWAVCAFGPKETDCLVYAAAKGGKCRIGFENSRHMSSGAIAQSNDQRVAELVRLLV
ncbi:3-keto-5-aminohexanoate cleavage enzyme [Pelagimonas phthalicica]|uniref:3-keto-5-aminohexanoate cleavage enzyme n=1 Tax=Pelagimonas phthalicica TaxID=1037362 RepID=A0A238J7X5_9RHOB|nr:3-keto-5-aminohexanoate cleavage protein [Pelagimonas phthalicica]TDS94989.1 uncharacterized protein (DUF849 family) [Pelagimonas phthalicica]SMX26485.1 3-keto-5-aminohexanoate cleavage enzyme [Pelagimonas phthalicica]